ncbi:hypothetical protein Mapa_013263 [Marchantia paleacea]|nr:hypothetical protein Mapa_013263 [Marchantia paleacea]
MPCHPMPSHARIHERERIYSYAAPVRLQGGGGGGGRTDLRWSPAPPVYFSWGLAACLPACATGPNSRALGLLCTLSGFRTGLQCPLRVLSRCCLVKYLHAASGAINPLSCRWKSKAGSVER